MKNDSLKKTFWVSGIQRGIIINGEWNPTATPKCFFFLNQTSIIPSSVRTFIKVNKKQCHLKKKGNGSKDEYCWL